MHPKDADRMANSVDPDQTGLSQHFFAQAYLSQYLEILLFMIVAGPCSAIGRAPDS